MSLSFLWSFDFNHGVWIMVLAFLTLFSSFVFALERVEGPWIKGRRSEYRYVTIYGIKDVKRPLKNFPWIEEDCHDNGNRFANWSKSHSYEITYSGALSFSLLGFLDVELGNERTKTVEFTFQRWVTPTLGIKARHVLHEEYEVWEGETLVEYRSGDNSYVADKTYPFRLDKMNYGISVERTNVQYCEELSGLGFRQEF